MSNDTELVLLEYHEIAAIVAEVQAKYPGGEHVAQYVGDRVQRAVLKRNAALLGAATPLPTYHQQEKP